MTAVVQINFDYDSSLAELVTGTVAVAPIFAGLDGLLWKIWLVNSEEKGTGGLYLFDSLQQAEAYANSDVVARLKADRHNVEVKVFEVLKEPSLLTNAMRAGAI